MASKFVPVELYSKGLWICHSCARKTTFSDPIKNKATPHCTNCGKHHPIHINCRGKSLVPPPIEYLQMFYSIPNPKNSVGVA